MIIKSTLLLLIVVGLMACNKNNDDPNSAKSAEVTQASLENNPAQKLSYSLGVVIASSMRDFDQVDLNTFFHAMKKAYKGEALLINEESARSNIMSTLEQRKALLAEQQAKQAEANKKASEAFLAENAKKEGVVTLESGLQYKVLQKGDGKKPKASDTVEVHYTGKLIDGKVFDSSVARGTPATFPVNGVIRGWTEALQLMPAGSKWTLYIPSELAYGEHGAGRDIGPNATLVFDVELLDVK